MEVDALVSDSQRALSCLLSCSILSKAILLELETCISATRVVYGLMADCSFADAFWVVITIELDLH